MPLVWVAARLEFDDKFRVRVVFWAEDAAGAGSSNDDGAVEVDDDDVDCVDGVDRVDAAEDTPEDGRLGDLGDLGGGAISADLTGWSLVSCPSLSSACCWCCDVLVCAVARLLVLAAARLLEESVDRRARDTLRLYQNECDFEVEVLLLRDAARFACGGDKV